MTIVESAVERARELTNSLVPESAVVAPLPRLSPLPLSPRGQIKPQPVIVDRELCRENRLLLSVTDDTDGAAVAAYRMLRTRLLHRVRAHKWMTIGITSAGPGEGKTTTALNLAFSLAREKNSEVVLLDLDMRNPSICRTLGVEPPRQLSGYFERRSSAEGLFFSIGLEQLVIGGQGDPCENASELLASDRFEDLLTHIQQNATNPIVIIDLPPVLSTDDALVLAPRLDAVLLIVAQERSERAELHKATELLSEFRLAGVVMNCSTERASRYDYDYGRVPGDRSR